MEDRTAKSPPAFEAETIVSDGTATVALRGELDIATAVQLDAALEDSSVRSQRRLVLDLRELSFMDSTGLRAVLAAHNRCAAEGRQLEVVRGPEAVQRLFELTKVDEHVKIVDEPS